MLYTKVVKILYAKIQSWKTVIKVYIIGLYFLLDQVLEKWDYHLVKV